MVFSLYIQVVYPGGMYGVYIASRTQPAHEPVSLAARMSALMTVLSGVSKRLGYTLRKEASLTLRINLQPRGNLSIMAKKPSTESTPAQGRQEYANPYGTALKPPSRLEQADTAVSQPLRPPVPGRLFCIKVSKSG